jgi:hypothetical protein
MNVNKLWFDDGKIFIRTDDGRELWQSLLWYPRLLHASLEQCQNYEIGNTGIRWEEIDEDMSFDSFLYEDPEPIGVAKIFRKYPELNVSAVSRRMGMKQSLLAAYISGHKKPSKERENEILSVIKQIGKELQEV